MDSISYSAARRNLGKVMDQVCNDHSPVIITRKGKASTVMMSLKEYQAVAETTYLLGSRANALDLFESIRELENDKEDS